MGIGLGTLDAKSFDPALSSSVRYIGNEAVSGTVRFELADLMLLIVWQVPAVCTLHKCTILCEMLATLCIPLERRVTERLRQSQQYSQERQQSRSRGHYKHIAAFPSTNIRDETPDLRQGIRHRCHPVEHQRKRLPLPHELIPKSHTLPKTSIHSLVCSINMRRLGLEVPETAFQVRRCSRQATSTATSFCL